MLGLKQMNVIQIIIEPTEPPNELYKKYLLLLDGEEKEREKGN